MWCSTIPDILFINKTKSGNSISFELVKIRIISESRFFDNLLKLQTDH